LSSTTAVRNCSNAYLGRTLDEDGIDVTVWRHASSITRWSSHGNPTLQWYTLHVATLDRIFDFQLQTRFWRRTPNMLQVRRGLEILSMP